MRTDISKQAMDMKYQVLSLQLAIIAATCIAWSQTVEVPHVAGSNVEQRTAALLKESAAHDVIASQKRNTNDGFKKDNISEQRSETSKKTEKEVEQYNNKKTEEEEEEKECVCRCRPTRRQSVFRDCKDAHANGRTKSGVYTVRPDKDGPEFDVYCDMVTDGGGWTVFQRRQDGSVSFYRGWNDYVNGFGDLEGELFLGLDNLYRLATDSNSQLRVDLEDWDGAKAYAKYSTFGIGNSVTKYSLTVSGYSGNAGDSLASHNGKKFTTYDQDNDNYSGNCAVLYKGAYWYFVCHGSNINGAYLGTGSNRGVTSSYADGVVWSDWKGFYYSLKSTVMMARRK